MEQLIRKTVWGFLKKIILPNGPAVPLPGIRGKVMEAFCIVMAVVVFYNCHVLECNILNGRWCFVRKLSFNEVHFFKVSI